MPVKNKYYDNYKINDDFNDDFDHDNTRKEIIDLWSNEKQWPVLDELISSY